MKSGARLAAAAALCLVATVLGLRETARAGQAASPDIPLAFETNFTTVAYFEAPNEQSVRFRLFGDKATPLPDAQYDLQMWKLQYYNTDSKLQAVAEAPQCTYSIRDQVGSSPSHLKLTSGDGRFHTEGDGFLFRQDDSWLMISNHVHTVFKMHTRPLTRL